MFRVVRFANVILSSSFTLLIAVVLAGCAGEGTTSRLQVERCPEAPQREADQDGVATSTAPATLDRRTALLIAQEWAFNAGKLIQPVVGHASQHEGSDDWNVSFGYGVFECANGEQTGFYIQARMPSVSVLPDGRCYGGKILTKRELLAAGPAAPFTSQSRIINGPTAILLARAYCVRNGLLGSGVTTEMAETEDGGWLVVFNMGTYIERNPDATPPVLRPPVVVHVSPERNCTFIP